MAEGDTLVEERSLEETSTWAVAVVCLVLVVISIFIEHLLHLMGSWLKKKKKPALYEALEKIKAELMLMGFISLLLIVLGGTISDICVPVSIAATWRPCDKPSKYKNPEDAVLSRRRLLEFSDYNPRRSLATYYDKCADKGQLAFVSGYGIHQLHVFIFVLAVFHVFYCIITLILGKTKMKKWKYWENETKSIEYQYYNDPERFRFARDTSFGRRHLNYWSESTVTLWIVCFFRQFLTSVTKVDYMTLRHGFIMAHLAPGSETRFDFQKYISRSLEEDFKVVVGITPTIWFIAVLFLLTNTNGSYAYLWLPFIPLVIILLIGAKLQVIITKLGLRIQDRGDVVKGAPVVQPGDDLFWFGRPRLVLFLIHVVLFTNAFQLAFFIWAWYEYGLRSCFHRQIEDIVIRITMGVLIQVLCSYVTLPLYALVTQMGSTMKPTIFNDRVAAALKNWHHTAKKHTKHSQHSHSHSQATTPFSSRPATPTHGMSPTHGLSPVHLLHNYNHRRVESYQTSPTHPNFDNDNYDPESLQHESIESQHNRMDDIREQEIPMQEIGSTQLPPGPRAIRTQHEIRRSSSDFSFGKE